MGKENRGGTEEGAGKCLEEGMRWMKRTDRPTLQAPKNAVMQHFDL